MYHDIVILKPSICVIVRVINSLIVVSLCLILIYLFTYCSSLHYLLNPLLQNTHQNSEYFDLHPGGVSNFAQKHQTCEIIRVFRLIFCFLNIFSSRFFVLFLEIDFFGIKHFISVCCNYLWLCVSQ